MIAFQNLLQKSRSIRDFQLKNVPLNIIKDIIKDSCLVTF
jgi:hypothetical protein